MEGGLKKNEVNYTTPRLSEAPSFPPSLLCITPQQLVSQHARRLSVAFTGSAGSSPQACQPGLPTARWTNRQVSPYALVVSTLLWVDATVLCIHFCWTPASPYFLFLTINIYILRYLIFKRSVLTRLLFRVIQLLLVSLLASGFSHSRSPYEMNTAELLLSYYIVELSSRALHVVMFHSVFEQRQARAWSAFVGPSPGNAPAATTSTSLWRNTAPPKVLQFKSLLCF